LLKASATKIRMPSLLTTSEVAINMPALGLLRIHRGFLSYFKFNQSNYGPRLPFALIRKLWLPGQRGRVVQLTVWHPKLNLRKTAHRFLIFFYAACSRPAWQKPAEGRSSTIDSLGAQGLCVLGCESECPLERNLSNQSGSVARSSTRDSLASAACNLLC